MPVFPFRHVVDREMEVRAGRIGVAGAPDRTELVAPLHRLPFLQPRRISVEMGVIIDPAPVVRADIGRYPAAALAEEQLFDPPRRGPPKADRD